MRRAVLRKSQSDWVRCAAGEGALDLGEGVFLTGLGCASALGSAAAASCSCSVSDRCLEACDPCRRGAIDSDRVLAVVEKFRGGSCSGVRVALVLHLVGNRFEFRGGFRAGQYIEFVAACPMEDAAAQNRDTLAMAMGECGSETSERRFRRVSRVRQVRSSGR